MKTATKLLTAAIILLATPLAAHAQIGAPHILLYWFSDVQVFVLTSIGK